jgi:hypothetical protein
MKLQIKPFKNQKKPKEEWAIKYHGRTLKVMAFGQRHAQAIIAAAYPSFEKQPKGGVGGGYTNVNCDPWK